MNKDNALTSTTEARTERFTWKGLHMYLNGRKTHYGVSKGLPHMFYCETPLGKSLDHYNLSRAKQHTKTLAMKDYNTYKKLSDTFSM